MWAKVRQSFGISGVVNVSLACKQQLHKKLCLSTQLCYRERKVRLKVIVLK